MDNLYLLDLINEANARGGGMILNYDDKPAAVVLSIDKYNQLLNPLPAAQDGIMQQTAVLEKAFANMTKEKVLVTGGAGYIGGHLVKELLDARYQVVVLDNLSTGRRENIDARAVFVEGDLADENLLKDLFSANNFGAVFHMAASLEVEESTREPGKYFQNNVANTAKLLNAMDEAGVKKIIYSSTAAVYGEQSQEPITETSPLKPNNPYGSTKLLAERVIKYYCQYLGFQAVVFRYFNACGFNPQAHILPTHQSHLIYNVIEVALGNKPILEVYGNDYQTFDGTCIRDYVHVSDIALPHILALENMERLSKFEVFNIGTGKGFSVAQVANTASEVLNKIIPMEIAPRREGDAPITVADNTKLVNELGYHLVNSGLENILTTSWQIMKDI